MMPLVTMPLVTMPTQMMLCATLLAPALTSAFGQRSTVPLDLGWRTMPAPAPTCSYPVTVAGYMENSAWQVPSLPSTEEECAAAACAHGVQAFSFCPLGGVGCNSTYDRTWPGPGPHCVIGSAGRMSQYKAATAYKGWLTRTRDASKGAEASTPEMQPGFDDSDWKVVDIPHDASIEVPASAAADGPGGFVPTTQTFYRKHFNLPSAWQTGTALTLEVDGAMTTSSWFVNGVLVIPIKRDGYLPATIRLDTIPGANLRFDVGAGGAGGNLLSVWTDDSLTTGWWYEGSGLVRHARLIAAPAAAYLPPFAVATPHQIVGPVASRDRAADGLSAPATVAPTADITAAMGGTRVKVSWTVVAADSTTVLGSSSAMGTVPAHPATATIASPTIHLSSAELWSVARPYLHTLVTTVTTDNTADTVNTTFGIRGIVWDPGIGMILNTQRVKMRGFCNHESFAAVGAAIPPRIDLLRLQQLRGVGGNAWRTSHNPPEPALLDLADRLGVLVLDENRVFAP